MAERLRDAVARQGWLRRFAPSLRLHPREPYLPVDPASFFDACQAEEGPFAQQRLRKCRESGVLDTTVSTVNGQPSIDTVPATAFASFQEGRVHLHYWFFYPTNGYQGFKLVHKRPKRHPTVLFEAAPFAYHEGDWEHVIMRLNEDQTEMTHLGLSAHGDVPLLPLQSWQDAGMQFVEKDGERHPIIYAALNSHANYCKPGSVSSDDPRIKAKVERLVPFVFGCRWRTLDFVDILDLPSEDTKVYAGIDRHLLDWIRWDIAQLHDLTEHRPAWATYGGGWGVPMTTWSFTERLPRGVPGRIRFRWLIKLATKFNLLTPEGLNFNPPGPLIQTPYLLSETTHAAKEEEH